MGIITKKLLHHLQKTKKFLQKDWLYILVILCLIILILQILLLQMLKVAAVNIVIKDNPFPNFQSAKYPMLEKVYTPEISARAALVLDASSHVAIFSKNENLRFPPASTTKLVTALTALDYYHPGDILIAKDPHVTPVVLGLKTGERMTFENLLYAMLIPSANDAALTVAQNYPGGVDAFVAKMNEKVALLHLANTYYADPIGLNDDSDYTTVHDLAQIASYALTHPLLSQIMNTKAKVIQSVDGHVYSIKNTNELLGKYGIYGGKTGYTEEAGEVLVSSTKMNDGHIYILVVMKSDDRFEDTEKLLQLIQNNVNYAAIHP